MQKDYNQLPLFSCLNNKAVTELSARLQYNLRTFSVSCEPNFLRHLGKTGGFTLDMSQAKMWLDMKPLSTPSKHTELQKKKVSGGVQYLRHLNLKSLIKIPYDRRQL